MCEMFMLIEVRHDPHYFVVAELQTPKLTKHGFTFQESSSARHIMLCEGFNNINKEK